MRYGFVPRIGDPLLFWSVICLSLFGVAMVYSAGVLDVEHSIVTGLWRAQLMWFALAMLVVPLAMHVRPDWLQAAALPIYSVALVALALTLVIGTGVGTSTGVPRWIVLGPVRIHTAEMAKIPVILMLARVLAGWREAPTHLLQLWKPLAVVVPPMLLVLGQPDLGTVIVFGAILFAALYWAGTPLRLLFFLVSPAFSLVLAFHVGVWSLWFLVLLAVLALTRTRVRDAALVFVLNAGAGMVALPIWESLAAYQRNRLLVFLDPSLDPRGAGYNLIQSRIAVGAGGFSGQGFLEGSQKRLAFLPEQHTDFIFSVIGEELGFVGVAAVLLLFGLVFWRLLRIAYRAADPFASMLPFGLFAAWMVHVLVNTGMTIGMMPITGIPLPFLSYGGSFLLVNLVGMALVQRVAVDGARER